MNGLYPSRRVHSKSGQMPERTDPNLGTVKSRLNRARNRLARELRDYTEARIAGAGTVSLEAASKKVKGEPNGREADARRRGRGS